jgi:hypothetical protein
MTPKVAPKRPPENGSREKEEKFMAKRDKESVD